MGSPTEALSRTPVEPPEQPTLRRRATRRFAAGVAGGLADYYRTRPIWFRLLFLASGVVTGMILLSGSMDVAGAYDPGILGMSWLLALLAFGGTGVYLTLWWFVPRADLHESAAQRVSRRYPSARRWPGLALLGLGLAILLDGLGVWRADVVLAFALIAAGVLLFPREPLEADPGAPAAPTPTTAPASAATTSIDDTLARVLPPPERSALGWMTIGVTMLVVGGILIWANVADATPRLATVPAIALLVISAGLLVGAVVGRGRWLAVPALMLVPVILVASVIRLPLEGRFGDLNLRPRTLADTGGPYRVTAGGLSVDLTLFQEQEVDITFTASTVLGDVSVLVPYDAHVVAEGYAGYGYVQIDNRAYQNGFQIGLTARSEPKWGDGATIRLMLESGIGSVIVYRDYPTRRELRELRLERREEVA